MTREIIMYLIYGTSVIGTFWVYYLAAETSETARTLGRHKYLFTAFIISFIPLVGTVVLCIGLLEMVFRKPIKEGSIVMLRKPISMLPKGTLGVVTRTYKVKGVYRVEFSLNDRPVIRYITTDHIRRVKYVHPVDPV